MDIFQGSKALEDAAIQGIEWGLFLRHDMATPIQAFMILQCGEKKMIRVIADDENPVDTAKKLLADEKEDFNFVTIGAEVVLKNRAGEREDAILIEAYDVSLEKGVSICQSFCPKENGEFYKIGNINLVGQPELGIPVKDKVEIAEKEETAINAIQTEGNGGLINHVAMFTDADAFQLGYSARKYLRDKLSDEETYNFSGEFEIIITPNENIHREFLDFMLKNVFSEVVQGEEGQHFEETTNRKLNVVFKYDDQIIAQKDEEEEDALDRLIPKKASESEGGKSGCMKSVAFVALVIISVIWVW